MKALADQQTAVMHGRPGRRSGRARGARWLAASVATALVVGVLPAVAGATDYCVDATPACGPKNVASFEQALDQAGNAPDADRVFLGAATYTAPDESGFKYYGASGPVEVIGQGAGQTILTNPGPGNDGAVVNLFGDAGTSIHDLTIRLPQNAQMTGLMTTNTARRIEVVEDPTQGFNRSGAELEYGGTLEDSTVTLGNGQGAVAVRLGNGGGMVRRSVLSGRIGVVSDYGGTIEHSRVTGAYLGVHAFRNLTTITGSLIRTIEANAYGIFAEGGPPSQTVVNADGVTLVGPGLADTIGAGVGAELADADITDISINLTNAIIRGVSAPLSATPAGAGTLKVTASYSDYDPSGNRSGGGNASITETNVSNVGDARFVNAAGGDYHLLPGSPLIDAGDPATPQGLDLDGNALVADGNGDGSARRDMGAFELQPAPAGGAGQPGGGTAPVDHQPPLVSGFRATPSVFVHRTRFRYTLSEAARVTVRIQRALAGRHARYRTIGSLKRSGAKGPNRIRFAGRIGKRSLRPGRYRAVIAATDAAGNRSTLRRTRFRVAAN